MLARSGAIDRLRGRQSRDRTISGLLEEKPPTYTSSAAPANVLLQERRLRLGRELKALPAEQRQVIEMAFYEGLTQSEIAETAGIPLGTVKTRTLLAMKKLRKALGNEIRDLV
jgi:RNA polymerase sigma-70 factor (ECF subfamily)